MKVNKYPTIKIGMFYYRLAIALPDKKDNRCHYCTTQKNSDLCNLFQIKLNKLGTKGCHAIPCFFKVIHM